jgi:hypothetical protein
MSTELFPYRYVLAGFEIVIDLSWLNGTSPESVKWPLDGGYVTNDSALQIA